MKNPFADDSPPTFRPLPVPWYMARWPGISNVIAVKTSDANTTALDFVRAFYTNLAHGQTVQKSFDAAFHR